MTRQNCYSGLVCFVVLMLCQTGMGQALQTDSHPSYKLRYGNIKEKPWRYNLTVENVLQFDIPEVGMMVTRKTILTNDYNLTFISKDEKMNLQMAVMVNEVKNNEFYNVFRYGQILNTGRVTDFSGVNGKTFHMITTALGEELEYKGNEALRGIVRTQDGRELYIGMEFLFRNVLFDYPDKTIKMGDTWKVENTNKRLDPEGVEHTTESSTTFRMEGIEKIGQRDCIKIMVDAMGTTSGFQTTTGSNPGNYETHTGTFVSSGTVYVDPKEGVVVKMNHINTTRYQIPGTTHIRNPEIGNYTEPFSSTQTTSLDLQQ